MIATKTYASYFIMILLLISLIIIHIHPAAANTYSADSNSIYLSSRQIETYAQTEKEITEIVNQNNNHHFLLRLNYMPDDGEKQELNDKGVELISYIPNNAWYARIENPKSESLDNINFITNILPTDKISKNILNQEEQEVTIVIYFFEDVSEDEIQKIMNEYDTTGDSFKVKNTIFSNVWQLTTSSDKIFELANNDGVQWIESSEPEKIANVDTIRAVIHADEVQTEPYNLHASGYSVAIWDAGTVAPHVDFGNRIIKPDSGTVNTHATFVCGIMAGDGTNSENRGGTPYQWRGIATMPEIISYDWYGDMFSEINQAINSYNAKLSQNSWSYDLCRTTPVNRCPEFGEYYSASSQYDSIIRGYYGDKISFIGAAGNDGDCYLCQSYLPDFPYGTVAGPIATSKNALSVSGTNADTDTFWDGSSRGPTQDGRIKPDISSPACKTSGAIKSTASGDNYVTLGCGTSYAAPAVSGAVVLIYDQYNDLFGQDPIPSTVRAILYNTADDLGNIGPDYTFGYGRLNVQKAIDLIISDDGTNNIIHEAQIGNNEEDTYVIDIAEGQTELKTTLVWDDKEATPGVNVSLVNNLDLELESPSGQIYYPWILDPENPANPATNGVDNRNNAEQILLINPEPGSWTLRIIGTAIPFGPQEYSLIADASSTGYPILDPIGEQNIQENSMLRINVHATDPDNQDLLYYSNADEILPSDFSFDSATGIFEWTPTFDDEGIYYVIFNVTDGQFWDSETVQINVVNVNRAPIIAPIDDIVVNETFNATIVVDASDPDDDNLEYSINDSRFIVINNVFIWPTNYTSAGIYSFRVTVSDGEAEASRDVTVNVLDYYITGDANCNGIVNGIDVTYMVAYFKGINPVPYCGLLAIDVNGDCRANGNDVTYLVRYLKGIGPALQRGNCN